jgi:hypothetical protein
MITKLLLADTNRTVLNEIFHKNNTCIQVYADHLALLAYVCELASLVKV